MRFVIGAQVPGLVKVALGSCQLWARSLVRVFLMSDDRSILVGSAAERGRRISFGYYLRFTVVIAGSSSA